MSYTKAEVLEIENKIRNKDLDKVISNLYVRVEQPLEYIHATTTTEQQAELEKVFSLIEQIDFIISNNDFPQTELTEMQKIRYRLTD